MKQESTTCLECKHTGKILETVFHCKKINKWFDRQTRFFPCLWWEQKGSDAGNAQETHTPTKSQNLEQGCESPQKEQHDVDAWRNPPLTKNNEYIGHPDDSWKSDVK